MLRLTNLRRLTWHLISAVPFLSHASCNKVLADGLSFGPSCIFLQINSQSSLAISREEAILKGVHFSTELMIFVSVPSLSSSAMLAQLSEKWPKHCSNRLSTSMGYAELVGSIFWGLKIYQFCSPNQTYQLHRVSKRNAAAGIVRRPCHGSYGGMSVGRLPMRSSNASGLRKKVAPILCSSTVESMWVLSPQSTSLIPLKRLSWSPWLTSILSGLTFAQGLGFGG